MQVMIFDGSMEEFLTAVYHVYVHKLPALLYREEDYVPNLIDTPEKIVYDEASFLRVRKAMQEKFTTETLTIISHGLMNKDRNAPYLLLRYIMLCFKNPRVSHDYQNETIMTVTKLSRQVSLESHRFLGFVRFHNVNHIYISSIKPDHNILGFIAPHFAERYHEMNFIIYDEGRNEAIVCQQGHWILHHDLILDEAMLKNDDYEEAWKAYYTGVTIAARKNEKAQKRSMPKRYWSNLLEVQENNS